jgi:hypothetical protein
MMDTNQIMDAIIRKDSEDLIIQGLKSPDLNWNVTVSAFHSYGFDLIIYYRVEE